MPDPGGCCLPEIVRKPDPLRPPAAPTDDDGDMRCTGAVEGRLSLACSDFDGLIGDVSREPFSPLSVVSFDSRRLPAGRNSRELRLAVEEMVAAAAAGGFGKVRLDGGTTIIEPSGRRKGASVVRGPFVRETSRVDIGCSR